MTAREPLTNSVSVQELRHMREEQHLSNVEIAKRLDVHPATVGRYLGPKNMTVRAHGNAGKPLTQQMIDDIRSLYEEGKSIAGISEKLGIGWATVKKYVRDLGSNQKGARLKKDVMEDELPFPSLQAAREDARREKQAERDSEMKIISQKQTVKLQGEECVYAVEIDGDEKNVTIEFDGTEVMVLDGMLLNNFINELKNIFSKYFQEVDQ